MNCPIHLESIALDREEVVALPCGHVFCLACITKCLDAAKPKCPCPICKKPATKKQLLRLFLVPRSPSSSPSKSQVAGHLSAAEKNRARALRQGLENLEVDGSVKEVEQACADIDQFAEGVAVTSMDIEAKCLAKEIKTAASRFQTLILPELRELKSVRERASDLTEEVEKLKSTLHQKEKEFAVNHRKRVALEKDLADLQKSKRAADDKASALRETLSVTSEKLVDAQNVIHAREETVRGQEERLKEYKKWLADQKLKVDKQKMRIRDLEMHLNEQQASNRIYSKECPPGKPCAGPSSSHMTAENLLEHSNGQSDPEPPTKRQRTMQAESLADVKLDKSCFVKKPQASFQFTKKKVPEKRTAGQALPGLNVTKSGQVKGTVAVGSRQRLRKMG